MNSVLPVDARGRVVAQRLSSPFETREYLKGFVERVDVLRRELSSELLRNATLHDMKLAKVFELLKEISDEIMDTAPAVPCKCSVRKQCPYCKNTRWLSARRIREILIHTPNFTL